MNANFSPEHIVLLQLMQEYDERLEWLNEEMEVVVALYSDHRMQSWRRVQIIVLEILDDAFSSDLLSSFIVNHVLEQPPEIDEVTKNPWGCPSCLNSPENCDCLFF